MALPTAALRKASTRDEPLCHSRAPSMGTHLHIFTHLHTRAGVVFRNSKWKSLASTKATWTAVVNALCRANTRQRWHRCGNLREAHQQKHQLTAGTLCAITQEHYHWGRQVQPPNVSPNRQDVLNKIPCYGCAAEEICNLIKWLVTMQKVSLLYTRFWICYDAFMQENKSCTSNRNYSCHLQFNSVNHFLLI